MSHINTHEYTFSINDFGEPIVLKDSEAIATILVRLLLLEPGTIQSHPSMGVGLVSKYRYTMEDQLDKLKDDFRSQISKYLPQYQGVEVSAYMEEHTCYLTAKIDNTVYAFFYNSDSNDLQSTFKELNDL